MTEQRRGANKVTSAAMGERRQVLGAELITGMGPVRRATLSQLLWPLQNPSQPRKAEEGPETSSGFSGQREKVLPMDTLGAEGHLLSKGAG